MRASKTTKIIGGVAAATVAVGLVAANSFAGTGDEMGILSLKGLIINKVDGQDCKPGPCVLNTEAGKNFTIEGKLDGYAKGGGYAKPRFYLERNDGLGRWVKAYDVHATGFDKWTGEFVVQGFADKETGSANFRIRVKAGDFEAVQRLEKGSFGKWYKLGEINPASQSPLRRIIQSTNFMIGAYSYSQSPQVKSGTNLTAVWPAKNCTKLRGAMGMTSETHSKGSAQLSLTSTDKAGASTSLFNGLVKREHLTISKDLPKDTTKITIKTTDAAKRGGYLGLPLELFCSSKPNP